MAFNVVSENLNGKTKRFKNCAVLSHRLVSIKAITTSKTEIERKSETEMFLTAKLNLISGMVIGAATAIIMKQICKDKKKQKGSSASMETLNEQHKASSET